MPAAPRPHSAVVLDGPERAPLRAMLYAMRYPRGVLAKYPRRVSNAREGKVTDRDL